MENRIKDHIKGLFSRAAACDAKEEITQELIANLCEKYNDLVAQGIEPEQAYAQVVDGIGDVSEIIAFINASVTKKDFDFTVSFEGFENRMKDLAKDLEGPVKEVLGDLKSAAMSARDAAMQAKGPLKEMAKQVGSDLKSAVSNIEFGHSGKNTFRYDYEVPAQDVTSLEILAEAGNVTFGVSQNENIYVVELSRQPLDEDKRSNITLSNGILTISHGKNQVGVFFFGIGVFTSDYEIYLPKKVFDSIAVNASSGSIDLDVDLQCKDLRVKTASGGVVGSGINTPRVSVSTASGEVRLRGLVCYEAEIRTTSGDINIDGEVEKADFASISGGVEYNGRMGELNAHSTSGDFELAGDIGALNLKTVSGDIETRFNSCPADMNLETVSGDTKVYLPENDGFTLNYKRVSGDIMSDFNLLTSINSRSGYGVYRDGGLRTYTVGTVSGDIKLIKR